MASAPRPEPRHRRAIAPFVACCLAAAGLGGPALAQTPSGMQDTRHNLSVSGPGPIRALTEDRVCVFCHTPHNATPLSPLWNKELAPQVYTVYASPTLRSGPLPQPSGATKLCLTCHDGTIALGAVVNPAGGIAMGGGGTLPPGSLSDFGLDLTGHHPVSFSYGGALPNAELVPSPPPDLRYGGFDEIHCTTCHDPHDDVNGRFLLKDNRFSVLCTTCHRMTGWIGSAHATSTASVVGILPRPPKSWPTWTQLNEWGCETCHTPHFAPTAERLLNFTDAPPAPFSCTTSGCHTSDPDPPHPDATAGAVGARDIDRQIRKVSGHHPAGAARTGIRSVGCADCHNPHAVNDRKAEAPYVSGMLQGVSGVDRNGAQLRSATFEYELCFKCHADNTPDLDHVPRVLEVTNTRLAFDPENPSYHPVVGSGRNLTIPSIPSSFEPRMTPSQRIYCSDCHSDDEGGSRGPHGSSFAPILRQRYDTAPGSAESYDSYALCYRCHDRNSILRDDGFPKKSMRTTASGGGHSGHLSAGAPCSACHDPHGVNDSGRPGAAGTGSHTHLINFDTRIVLPKAGSSNPIFTDTGTFSGGCTLVCHGVSHDNLSYP